MNHKLKLQGRGFGGGGKQKIDSQLIKHRGASAPLTLPKAVKLTLSRSEKPRDSCCGISGRLPFRMWCHMVSLRGSGPQPAARAIVNARAKMSALGRWQYCYSNSRKEKQMFYDTIKVGYAPNWVNTGFRNPPPKTGEYFRTASKSCMHLISATHKKTPNFDWQVSKFRAPPLNSPVVLNFKSITAHRVHSIR